MSWLPKSYKEPASDIDDDNSKEFINHGESLPKINDGDWFDLSVYFAGKMSNWREEIYDDKFHCFDLVDSPRIVDLDEFEQNRKFKEHQSFCSKKTIWKNITAKGPFRFSFSAIDKNGETYKKDVFSNKHTATLNYEDDFSTNIQSEDSAFWHVGMIGKRSLFIDRKNVFQACKKAIKDSELIICWMDTTDCHGTITEIGYAHSLNIPIIIFYKKELEEEIWFPLSCAYKKFIINEDLSVRQNFELMLGDKLTKETVYLMQYEQSASYKIGKTSRNADLRQKELNGTKAPNEIKLHESIFTDDASFLEKVLHQRFSDSRTRGEWFELTPQEIFEFVTLSKISKFQPLTKDTISALEKDALIFSESQQIEHDLFWHKYNQLTKSSQSGGKSKIVREAIKRLKEEGSYIPALS
jgi:nucleoside 2-deoxyribosyltransferase